MPDTSVVDAAVHRMDGWTLGAQQPAACVALAPGKHETATLRPRIEANAKAIADPVGTIAAKEASLPKAVASKQAALDSYSEVLQDVTANSNTISTKAVPSLQRTASLLGKIDSIFDPL